MEEIIGIWSSVGSIGMMAGPLVGIVLYAVTGFSSIYIVFGIIFLVYLPFLRKYLP
jgi:hypothetical protein